MNNNNTNILFFPNAAQNNNSGRRLLPERLYEARILKSFSQTELAKMVGVSNSAISAYEKGDKQPEPETFKKISEALNQPIYFFTKMDRKTFGTHSPNFFRKTGPKIKKLNLICDIYSQWLSSTAFAFANYANFPKMNIPEFKPSDTSSRTYSDDEIELLAETVRNHFGLGLGPISNVIRLLEYNGVIISRMKMIGKNIDAFSFWSGDVPFLFLASDKTSAARFRFDAAHELAHLCLHKWVKSEELEDKDRLKIIEREADRFASAFLLPKKTFSNEIYSARAEAFIDLKARWKVSIQAMIYRCKDLGIFDERQCINLYKQISYKNWRKKEPLDSGPQALKFETPLLLKKISELVFTNELYKFTELKYDVGLDENILMNLLSLSDKFRDDKNDYRFEPTLI